MIFQGILETLKLCDFSGLGCPDPLSPTAGSALGSWVISSIPAYFENKQSPIICYKYN